MLNDQTLKQQELFAEDFPVNPTVMQGKNFDQKTTASSGRKCFEYWMNLKPNASSSLRRMYQQLMINTKWYSTERFLIWKISGTKSGLRLKFQLAPSMRHTNENELSLWLTPKLPSGGGCNRTSKGGGQRKLEDQIRGLWATPAARDCKGKNSAKHLSKKKILTLTGQIRPLSNAETEKSAASLPLNPEFTRWLMGFPEGWLNCEGMETQSSRKSLKLSAKV